MCVRVGGDGVDSISALWISMEYLEGGSLQDLIKISKGNLDEHTTQWVLREIVKVRGVEGVPFVGIFTQGRYVCMCVCMYGHHI